MIRSRLLNRLGMIPAKDQVSIERAATSNNNRSDDAKRRHGKSYTDTLRTDFGRVDRYVQEALVQHHQQQQQQQQQAPKDDCRLVIVPGGERIGEDSRRSKKKTVLRFIDK
jgi:hypothetical protein